MVRAEDVIKIYKLLSAYGIQVWLTGGWGIDALLGEQTRPHKDLDVIMLLEDVVQLRVLLSSVDYRLKELWSENRWAKDSEQNTIATAFVLHDLEGRELDVHAMNLDDRGNGIPAWDDAEDFIFKEQDLKGSGWINGVAVQCISPQSQMICHTGYALPDEQMRDLDLLHKKFGVVYPDGYLDKRI